MPPGTPRNQGPRRDEPCMVVLHEKEHAGHGLENRPRRRVCFEGDWDKRTMIPHLLQQYKIVNSLGRMRRKL